MSLEVLRLGSIKLEDTSEKLILVANATVELRVKNPDGQLTDWNKDLLETGNIWVTRGAGLSLDVEIYFNGNPLDENCCLDILQTVGHRVVDAKFWSSLCLSTIVEFLPESDLSRISVKINESTTHTGSGSDQSPISKRLQQSGLPQPSSVPSVKLEKIFLQCNFRTKPLSKRRKTEPLRASRPDIMLLDHRTKPSLKKPNIVKNSMPDSLVQFSSTSNNSSDPRRSPQLLRHDSDQGTSSAGSRGKRFPKHVVNIVKDWVAANTDKAYPDEHDRIKLAKETGLQWKQIYISVRYYKKREQKDCVKVEDEMLLEPEPSASLHAPQNQPGLLDDMDDIQDDDEMLLIEDINDLCMFDEKLDMLLGMNTNPLLEYHKDALPSPAPTEASSSQSSDDIPDFSEPSLKRGATTDLNETSSKKSLDMSDCMAVSQLVDVALRNLIGGNAYWQPKQIALSKKKSFDLALQLVSPCLFNPGFKQAMTRNSKFVPIISRSFSTTIFHRAQSPALKQKLARLSELAKPLTPISAEDSPRNHGEALSLVLQSRLWAMMQRAHFNPSHARRLLRDKSGDGPSDEAEDFEDLFDEEQAALDDAEDDDADGEFDNLLDDDYDHDGFLDYFAEAEQERLSTEREIEEMLLGEEQDTDQDSILFPDATEEDSFLF